MFYKTMTTLVFACFATAHDPATADDVCGNLLFDDGASNGISYRRQNSEVKSWVMVPSESNLERIGGCSWVAFDDTPEDWTGLVDVGIWETEVVEEQCANDETALVLEEDVPGTRVPLLDSDGNQYIFFGRLAWIYTVDLDIERPPGKAYFGVRAVLHDGKGSLSSIIKRECLPGEGFMYFQCEVCGIPCAVPGEYVFLERRCMAVSIFSWIDCDLITRTRLRCLTRKVKVRLRSSLSEGTILTLEANEERKSLEINSRGGGRVKFRKQAGDNEICILDCADSCHLVNCPE